jgi:alkylation response protein AidB-like acyl-CoA dehydrogenase
MDFALNDEQQAISDLAARIVADHVSAEALRAMERDQRYEHPGLWAALARADLLGTSLPTGDGGAGYGLVEACLVAEQIGYHAAPVPYLEGIAGAAGALAAFGTPAQRSRHLPGVIEGAEVLTVALHEPTTTVAPTTPSTLAERAGAGWCLRGTKVSVPWAEQATVVLVPARLPEGRSALFLVPTDAEGVSRAQNLAVTGQPLWSLHLEGVELGPDGLLGQDPAGGPEALAWLLDRLTVALCAAQAGVCARALALTAAHVSQREQFGAKLGTFQAVAQRAADAYIDTEAVRLTMLHAAWRLDAGLPARDEVLVAKFWAADGAQRVVHAAQHLHGGVGMDTDYPLHRCFRWAKVLELGLGGATASLLGLGARLACSARQEAETSPPVRST